MLVPIEGDGVAIDAALLEEAGQLSDAFEVGVIIAADFHLEIAQAVFVDAFIESLRQPVAQAVLTGDVAGADRVAQTYGMPAVEPFARLVRKYGGGLESREIIFQQLEEGQAAESGESIEHRPLEERAAEGRGQRVESGPGSIFVDPGKGGLPVLGRGRGAGSAVEVDVPGQDHRLHLVLDVPPQALFRILVKPARRQAVGGDSPGGFSIGVLDREAYVEGWSRCHAGDTVAKRHPRGDVVDEGLNLYQPD